MRLLRKIGGLRLWSAAPHVRALSTVPDAAAFPDDAYDRLERFVLYVGLCRPYAFPMPSLCLSMLFLGSSYALSYASYAECRSNVLCRGPQDS